MPQGSVAAEVTGPSSVSSAVEHTPALSSRAQRSPSWPTIGLHTGVIAGYLALSVLMWWRVWVTGHPTSTITCLCGDPSVEVWWLEWLPWAILHGHNPFFTNALYAGSGGVNGLASPTAMFPALIVSPVTLLFGPIAAFNVAATLAPVVSGWCMFLFARKFTRFVPAQVVAGLLWGFSPFVVDNLPYGHIHLALGYFPPLAGLVLYDLLVERKRRPWVDGLLLGALVIAEFFTAPEILVLMGLVAPVGLAMGIILAPRPVWDQRRALLVAGGTSLAMAVALLAYPLWFAVAGPRHVTGRAWPDSAFAIDPITAVVNPGAGIHRFSWLQVLAGYHGALGPYLGYLGWGVLAFIIVSTPVWWRRKLAWCALVAGTWAWALSRGSPQSGGWWPWHLFDRIPSVSSAWPARFADLVALCAALLMAISMDGWWRWAKDKTVAPRSALSNGCAPGTKRAPILLSTVVVVAAAAAALAPIVASYTLPFSEQSKPIPAWFTHEARRLPERSRVLTIPYPTLESIGNNSMVYQAQDSMRFDLAGGYELIPGAGGTGSILLHPLGGTTKILEDLTLGPFGAPKPAISAQTIAEVRTSLHQWGIQVVVVEHGYASHAVPFMTAVYGRPPVTQHRAFVWYGEVAKG